MLELHADDEYISEDKMVEMYIDFYTSGSCPQATIFFLTADPTKCFDLSIKHHDWINAVLAFYPGSFTQDDASITPEIDSACDTLTLRLIFPPIRIEHVTAY